MSKKRLPLPKRFGVALSDKAWSNLRALSARYGYGNNYLLTILLENLDAIVRESAMENAFAEFKAEYGAPETGKMKTGK